jgi:hypothetical protein
LQAKQLLLQTQENLDYYNKSWTSPQPFSGRRHRAWTRRMLLQRVQYGAIIRALW